MKRSEMLKIMNSFLDNLPYYEREIDYEDMDTLLYIMEKAGMKPPYRPSDEKVIRCQISEWEPEDE